MKRRTLGALGLAALAASSTFPTTAFAQEKKDMPRVISVLGHGEVKARPDMAIVTVGVLTQDKTARDALTANNAAMEQILASLKSAGIAETDIQTTNFMVNPRYDYSKNNMAELVGFDVSNNVNVTVRDLARLGSVLDGVVSQGSNQINGIFLSIADPKPLEDEARKLAVTDAARKAKLYAEAAGVSLGNILAINETGGAAPPVPIPYNKVVRADAASVPIAEGEQTVAIDASITWEIQ